jgi:hypothetical protein
LYFACRISLAFSCESCQKADSVGTQEFSFEYTKEYLQRINFDLDACKKPFHVFIKQKCKNIHSVNRCRIINHVVASINDFKKYLDEQKTNLME